MNFLKVNLFSRDKKVDLNERITIFYAFGKVVKNCNISFIDILKSKETAIDCFIIKMYLSKGYKLRALPERVP